MLLDLKNISFAVNKKIILEDVNLQIGDAVINVIVGPNGSGKTSLFRIIIGEAQKTSGTIARAKDLRIGYVPQKLRIASAMPITVERFLTIQKSRKKYAKSFISEYAKKFNIASILNYSIHSISGGELQRVLLARACLESPNLLLLDEPTQGLDLTGQSDFYKIVSQLRTETGCSILIISHDLYAVMRNTDHIYCLNKTVCCEGSPVSIQDNEIYKNIMDPDLYVSLYRHNHHN